MKHKINTLYCHETVQFVWGEYSSGQHALQLIGPNGPEMVATSHLPLEDISKDELVVKDYSENEGILQELIRLKIVEAPKRFVRSGFVSLPICKLLINPN